MTDCSVEACDQTTLAKGFCVKHYTRWKKHGDPLKVAGRWDNHTPTPRECSIDGCETVIPKGSLCGKHRQRKHRHGDPTVVLERGSRPQPLAERLWAKVTVGAPDECWLWTASIDGWGYGTIGSQGQTYRAHRVVFWLTHGHWPTPVCRHTCDTPACCNPGHLLEGSVADNNRDTVERGRDRHPTGSAHGTHTKPESRGRGERNGSARLAESDVRRIRELRSQGVRRDVVAAMFGVHESTIYAITSRKKWSHIE